MSKSTVRKSAARKGKPRTRMIVTRVFDGQRTAQEAFVRVILNAEGAKNEDNRLQWFGEKNIIEDEPTCGTASPLKGEANG